MKRAVIVMFLVGAPASAQINTQCQTTFGITNCQTTGVPQGPSGSQMMLDNMLRQQQANQQQLQNNSYAIIAAARARQAQQAQNAAQANDDWQHKQVGSMIAAGHCDAAEKFALDTGDLTLAAQAKQLCAKP